MKKLFLVVILILPFVSKAQKMDYVLKGKLGTLSGPARAYLTSPEGNIRESVEIKDGHFEFKGTIEEPVKAVLYISHQKIDPGRKIERLVFYLDSGAMEVAGKADAISNAELTGSKVNADNKELQAVLMPVKQQMAAFEAAYKEAAAKKQKEEAELNMLSGKMEANREAQHAILLNFINTHPNSFISLLALKDYVGSIPEYTKAAPLFSKLSPDVQNTKSGKDYAFTLAQLKATVIGEMAPDFTQNDVDGKPVRLSDFKGKYVLVDFWASWCGPCRKENPNLVKAYAAYHPKGLEVLGVSLDVEMLRNAWIDAIRTDNLTWLQVSDLKGGENEAARLYGIMAIPQNVLIDPQGRIVAKNLMGQDLNKKLAEVL